MVRKRLVLFVLFLIAGMMLVACTPADSGDTGDTGGADTGEVEPAVFTARAGLPFMAYPGDLVILDGRNSTGPGTLQYQWTQVAGEDPRPLGMDTAQPQFTAREPGTLVFQLVVGDGEQWSEPAYSYVAVLDPSIASKGCGCSTSSTRSMGLWLTLVPVMLWLRRKTT